jgi:preprotein translocase subunit SecF
MNERFASWYDSYYKHLLVLPALLLLFSFISLGTMYAETGNFFAQDISLTGGTALTVFDTALTPDALVAQLQPTFSDVHARAITDIRTGAQKALYIESKADAAPLRTAVEQIVGYPLTSENSSVEFSGALLSTQFYQQLMQALFVAFLLMAAVVFVIFAEKAYLKSLAIMLTLSLTIALLPGIRTIAGLATFGILCSACYGLWYGAGKRWFILGVTLFSLLLPAFAFPLLLGLVSVALFVGYARVSLPSAAVALAAFADIIMTVALVNVLGIEMSLAGIIALLMLIGYSVDTDILLTTRLLKERTGTLNHRLWDACKTGVTMTLTAIVAVGISLWFVASYSDTLAQIFTIMLFGLVFDLFNTWITNASILKWFLEGRA